MIIIYSSQFIIKMYNDIEEVISDNLSLKKAYHVSKSHGENLQQQLLLLKQEYKHLATKYEELTQINTQLNQKNKKLQMDLSNDTATFVSQIEELKYLIEQKEQELQNFQLKMIPSLDQDMLRVKIIAEMEGPYQETVDKKDRQISKLKDLIHELKRDKEILQFSLANKERQAKREIEQIKQFSASENQRLSRQLAHYASKQNTGKIDKDIIRNYRREIEELRTTQDLQKTVEDDLRREIVILKNEKAKLLQDLANTNARKALDIHNSSNQGELRNIKNERNRFEEQASRFKEANQKLERKMKTLEIEKNKIISTLQHDLKEIKSSWEREKESFRNECLDHRDEIRRLKDVKNRQEEDYISISQKYKALQLSHQSVSEENRNLKIRINLSEQSLQNSRSRRQDISERSLREKIQREVRIKMEREIRQKIQLEMMNETRRGHENISPNKEDGDDFKKTSKSEEKIRKLEQKNKKLSEKLQYANRKIVELLKEKAQKKEPQKHDHASREHESFSDEHSYNRILLEHRDCSFVPLAPPVIFEDLHYRGP